MNGIEFLREPRGDSTLFSPYETKQQLQIRQSQVWMWTKMQQTRNPKEKA